MAVRLTLDLDDAPAADGLARLIDLGEHLDPILGGIGGILEQSARDRIGVTNLGPDGTPWTPSRRARRKAGGRTLWDTGRLVASLTHSVSGGSVSVGSGVIHAGVHQFGATIRPKTARALSFVGADGTRRTVKSVTIPARPYLGVSAEDRDDILDLLAQRVARAAGGAAGGPAGGGAGA